VRFFFEAGRDTSELLELGEAAFDEVALGVEMLVKRMLEGARRVVGNDGNSLFIGDCLSQSVAVIGRIGDDDVGG
jgi:hypothetical protein